MNRSTEVRWEYSPADFFEAPFAQASIHGTLRIRDGCAVIEMTDPNLTMDETLRDQLYGHIRVVFDGKRLLTHRKYTLSAPTFCEHREDGSTSATVYVTGVIAGSSTARADILVRDDGGSIIRDSRAERIANHETFLSLVAKHSDQDPLVSKLMASYGGAVEDPADELIHLYEVRDALADHFGGEKETRGKLGITSNVWSRIGELANSAPIKQGRHRGRDVSLRDANQCELEEARELTRGLVTAYLGYLESHRR